MIKGLEHKTMALAVDDLVLHLVKLREMLVVCSKRFGFRGLGMEKRTYGSV
jgi:hypothetical protein